MTDTFKAVLREWMRRRVQAADGQQSTIVERSGVKSGNFSCMLSGKRSPTINYFERIVAGEAMPLYAAFRELADIAFEQEISRRSR